MIRIPKNRISTHPGEMFLEEFLQPMGLTQRLLADAIQVPYQWVNEIINGRRGITPSTALRLAKFFATSSGCCLNLQHRWDIYDAQKAEQPILDTIQPYPLNNPQNLTQLTASH